MRTLIMLLCVLSMMVSESVAQQSAYILTDYQTARLVWDNPTPGPNNIPEATIAQCTVNNHPYSATVPYPGNEVRIAEIVPLPQSAEYVCVAYAVNRAGRSVDSNTVRFYVLKEPLPPSNVRIEP